LTISLFVNEVVVDAAAFFDDQGHLGSSGATASVPWWSFGKTVLSIAALRLVERGSLSLHAPVEGRAYSLAQLLRHEAGLPDYGGLARYHEDVAAAKAPWPVERLLAALDADRPRYAPGEGWAYSNLGYLKVAQLIEQASDLALGDALQTLVFQPAGLASARLATTPEDLIDVQMGDAAGYHPGWVYHGLITGTVTDAARLLRGLLTRSLLRPETFALMVEGRALPEHRSAVYPDPAYGLGLMHWAHDPLDHPIGHSGAGPGSHIAVYGQGRRVCALWEASAASPDLVAAKVFERLKASG
jgi:CubicO group peptidase (beta-lactamase class C family)